MSIQFTFSTEKAIRKLNKRRFTRNQAIGYLITFLIAYFIWIPFFFGSFFFAIPIIIEFFVLRKCSRVDRNLQASFTNFFARYAYIGLIACKYFVVPFILIRFIEKAADLNLFFLTVLLIIPYAMGQKSRIKMHSKIIMREYKYENRENSDFLAQLDSLAKSKLSENKNSIIPDVISTNNSLNRCPQCGQKVRSFSKKCPFCEAMLFPTEVVCPTCGYVNKSDFESCMFCNNPMTGSSDKAPIGIPLQSNIESIPVGVIVTETPLESSSTNLQNKRSSPDISPQKPSLPFDERAQTKAESEYIEGEVIENENQLYPETIPEPKEQKENKSELENLGLTPAPQYEVPLLTTPDFENERSGLTGSQSTQFEPEENIIPAIKTDDHESQISDIRAEGVCKECLFLNDETQTCELKQKPLYDYYCYHQKTMLGKV